MVIAHRPGDTYGIPSIVRENVGLEFGAYDYFLQQYWDQSSNVLFLHDDIEVPIQFFQAAQTIPFDQAYIFRNPQAYQHNLGHGRAMYAAAAFLVQVQLRGGIWYDAGNTGFVAQGPSWSEQSPAGCQDHNAGIRAFMTLSRSIGEETNLTVNQPFYFPSASFGHRGQLEHQGI
jgi:hypothetical protein